MPADNLAQFAARTYAGTLMIKFDNIYIIYIYIYIWDQHLAD